VCVCVCVCVCVYRQDKTIIVIVTFTELIKYICAWLYIYGSKYVKTLNPSINLGRMSTSNFQLNTVTIIYIYMYMCVCVYIYIYIYIFFHGFMKGMNEVSFNI
jgi:hypothetical protein